MAVTALLTCSACERIILPGDTFGIVSTVVLIRTTPDSVEFEDRNPGTTVHYCAQCSQAASEAIAALAQEPVQDEPMVFEAEPDEDEEEPLAGSTPNNWGLVCTPTCCGTCAKDDRCCEGYPKAYLGFDASREDYLKAVRTLGLRAHERDAEMGVSNCNAGGCSYAGIIKDELKRMGCID